MRTAGLILAVGTLTATPALAADGKDVFGLWRTESGNAVVEIADCGDGTPCGTIADIDAANAATLRDVENPDPALAAKPLIGSRMLWGFKAKSDKWSSGRIYDAESGKTYKSKLERQADGTLKVKGCVGPICQGQIWTAISVTS